MSHDDLRKSYKGPRKHERRQTRHKDSIRYSKYLANDEYFIIDFEGNGVPSGQDPASTNILAFDPSYVEDGFILSAQTSEGSETPSAET